MDTCDEEMIQDLTLDEPQAGSQETEIDSALMNAERQQKELKKLGRVLKRSESANAVMESGNHRRLMKLKSWSGEAFCEQAWARKRLLHQLSQRSRSDCGRGRDSTLSTPTPSPSLHTRNPSLTDDDLEELKGCIDLGFGFDEEVDHPELSNTLPALQILYSVARQFQDPPESSSSASSSPAESPARSWQVSSPGDDPQQVKKRLRHWAQVVGCLVKLGHRH